MTTPSIPHLSAAEQRQRAESLLVIAYRSGITDPAELANFMAQTQHESQHYRRLEENLNYSGSRLYDVFGARNGLTRETAQALSEISDPIERRTKVAEQIYGGTWGLNNLRNTDVGDGYKFSGRGYMQLTGRGNYAAYGGLTGLDLVNHPELASEQTNAERLAVAYWKEGVVKGNPSAATDVGLAGARINTGRYNGTANGAQERQTLADAWSQAFDKGYLQDVLSRHPVAPSMSGAAAPAAGAPPASRPSEHELQALVDHHSRHGTSLGEARRWLVSNDGLSVGVVHPTGAMSEFKIADVQAAIATQKNPTIAVPVDAAQGLPAQAAPHVPVAEAPGRTR